MLELKIPTGKLRMRTKMNKLMTISRERFSWPIRLVCCVRVEVCFINFFQFIRYMGRHSLLRQRRDSLCFFRHIQPKKQVGPLVFSQEEEGSPARWWKCKAARSRYSVSLV